MKLAVVPLPNEMRCEVVPKEGQAPPPIFLFGRAKQVAVLSGLLLCALALVGTTYFVTADANPVASTPSVAGRDIVSRSLGAGFRPLVRTFDGSQTLKIGDLVILNGSTSPNVRQIVARPNEAVLLRRGNALQGIYMAGERNYVVVSDKEGRIVSADEIRGVIPPVLATAAR